MSFEEFDGQEPTTTAGQDVPGIEKAYELKAHRMKQAQLQLDTVERQKDYVARQKAKGAGVGIVFQDAFLRGMRDLGYKDPAWALAELIDNSVQAGGTSVEIRLDFAKDNPSKAKNPAQIAIVDNGTGMAPEMIGYAVRWGGTDREDDRNGFGRFGYGLPSACVSIACRYTVYSKVKDGDWHAVTIDLQQLAEASSDPTRTEELLRSKKVALPAWLTAKSTGSVALSDVPSGTVIVLEDLDRLRKMTGWILVKSLRERLLHQFGLVYRHWIPDVQIHVDGIACQAVDPLFLLPHARFFDETTVRAQPIAQRAFEVDVPGSDGLKGTVRIRAAYLHPQTSWATPDDLTSGATKNKRWEAVLKPERGLNGLLVCREGRQIDVVQPSWTKFQNNDVYTKIEIDFDPVLDELFSITTSKQQIRIDESMFDKLTTDGKNAGGLASLLKDMRGQLKKDKEALKAKVAEATEQKEKELASANAMKEAERFKTRTPRPSEESKAQAERNLEDEATARAKETGIPKHKARKQIEEEVLTRPWDIEYQAINEGPFYSPKRLGEQKRIVLNTAHPFYSRIYAPASPSVQSALQVLLFVLADGEIDADGQRLQFYQAERNFWSQGLSHALVSLVSQASLDDDASSEMEEEEQARAAAK